MHKMACISCDLLIELPVNIESDKQLVCPRCKHTITNGHKNSLDFVLALAMSSTIMLIASYWFTFISFRVKGQFRDISLIDASAVLFEQNFYLLSILVLLFTLLLPVIYLTFLLLLLIPIKLNFNFINLIYFARLISKMLPWIMVDVFLMGVVVALIKISSMAEIYLGASFWCYLLFTISFAYLSTLIDSHKIWYWVDNG